MAAHTHTAQGADSEMESGGKASHSAADELEYTAGAWGVVALIVGVFALFFATALATYGRLSGWS